LAGAEQSPVDRLGRIRNLTRKVGALPSGLREDELHYWRERILFVFLLSGVVFGPFALMPALMLLIRRGLWQLVALDIGVYAAALVIFFSRHLTYKVRALGLCLLIYIVGLGVINFLGPLSGGPAWLFTFSIMAGILLGLKAALAALGVNAITLVWLGWLISLGHFSEAQPLVEPLARGVAAGANFLFLNSVTAISASVLVRGLEAMLGRERTAAAALERERARLELVNRQFAKEIEERRRAEGELQLQKTLLEHLIEQAPVAIVLTDDKGRITRLNREFVHLFDYTLTEATGRHIDELMGAGSMAEEAARLTREVILGRKIEVETERLRKDGSLAEVLITASPIRFRDQMLGVFTIYRDIAERRRAEVQLKAALQEKEVLLREIHHRVKNNMQIVSSLLNLQARGLKDEQAQSVLRESRGRIQALALVHEALYRSEALAEIDFRQYMSKLTDNIFQAYTGPGGRIRTEVTVEELALDLDHAVTCGLAVNELITNSLRHAFPGGRGGSIAMKARLLNPEEIELTVSDDGVGLPQGFDWRKAETLGLQIVVAVVEEQLGGTVSLQGGQGTTFSLRFRHKPA